MKEVKRKKKKPLTPLKKDIKRADELFSYYIRLRDGGKCFFCGEKWDNPLKLDCMHYVGRNHFATRYDPDNCDSGDSCHFRSHVQGKETSEHTLKKIYQLGDKEFRGVLEASLALVKQRAMVEEALEWLIPWFEENKDTIEYYKNKLKEC